MRERATIVSVRRPDWLGRRYGAAVVSGTIERYYPASAEIFRWTAAGAKRAGDRRIRRIEQRELRQSRRERAARLATGYERGAA